MAVDLGCPIFTSRSGHVALEWRPPLDGGPAAAYTVQRRTTGGPWEDVATAAGNECLLGDQPRGVEFDLRVVAVNKAGGGGGERHGHGGVVARGRVEKPFDGSG